MRITTVPLETKLLAQLDKHSAKLLEVIRRKGGAVRQKTSDVLQLLDETLDINTRRECILTSLMIYLGEPVEHLIKEYQDVPENEAEELQQTAMAILITGREGPLHPAKDIKIIIEGTEVLRGLPSVTAAFTMIFGLMYTLNLKYPKKLESTFEFVQKILMDLDRKKMSPKVNKLCSQLYSSE